MPMTWMIDGVHGDLYREAMGFPLLSSSALTCALVKALGDQCDRRDRQHLGRRRKEWLTGMCASSAVRGNRRQGRRSHRVGGWERHWHRGSAASTSRSYNHIHLPK